MIMEMLVMRICLPSRVAKISFLKCAESHSEIAVADWSRSVDMHTHHQIFKLLMGKYSAVQIF